MDTKIGAEWIGCVQIVELSHESDSSLCIKDLRVLMADNSTVFENGLDELTWLYIGVLRLLIFNDG